MEKDFVVSSLWCAIFVWYFWLHLDMANSVSLLSDPRKTLLSCSICFFSLCQQKYGHNLKEEPPESIWQTCTSWLEQLYIGFVTITIDVWQSFLIGVDKVETHNGHWCYLMLAIIDHNILFWRRVSLEGVSAFQSLVCYN